MPARHGSQRLPDAAFVLHDDYMALTEAEQQGSADLIQRLLDLVDDGHWAADGPGVVALARRLEGAMLALRALDGSSERGQIEHT